MGGVLIDWNPEYVYLEVFEGDRKKMQWFFDEICTMDWNENQDAGYPFQSHGGSGKNVSNMRSGSESIMVDGKKCLGEPLRKRSVSWIN